MQEMKKFYWVSCHGYSDVAPIFSSDFIVQYCVLVIHVWGIFRFLCLTWAHNMIKPSSFIKYIVFWLWDRGILCLVNFIVCYQLRICHGLILPGFLAYLSRRIVCTIVIMHCPSSIICPSMVTFTHFQLFLVNCWTEFDKAWLEKSTQRPFPSLCLLGWSINKDGHPFLWLAGTFSATVEGNLTKLDRKQVPLSSSVPSLCSSCWSINERWLPRPLIDGDIFYPSSAVTVIPCMTLWKQF